MCIRDRQRIERGYFIEAGTTKRNGGEKETRIAGDILRRCTSVPVSRLSEEINYLAVNPVSYTHLDVYKRQDLNTPNGYAEIYETVKKLNQALRQREIQWDQVGAEVGALEKMLEVLGIDVYKRQPLNS